MTDSKLMYWWGVCFASFFIWTCGVKCEIAALRWIGVAALFVAAVAVMIYSLRLHKSAYSEAKENLKGVDVHDKKEIIERSSSLALPISSIINIIIFALGTLALNFFYFA